MKTQHILWILVIFTFSVSLSDASLYFKLSCDDPDIAVDDETIVTISAYDDQAVANYGLVEWNFDLWTLGSSTGLIEVTSASILNEGLYVIPSVSGMNSVNGTGSVSIGAAQLGTDPMSNIGVDDYVDIATVTLKGVSVGDVVYTLGSITTPDNFFGRVRDAGAIQQGSFLSGDSVIHYTVVPEPSSLLLLCGLGILHQVRRKRG